MKFPMNTFMNNGIIVSSKISLESHRRVNNNGSWHDVFYRLRLFLSVIQFSVRFTKIDLPENIHVLRYAMPNHCEFHPLCQFGWIDPHRLQEGLFVVLSQERLGFFFKIIFIDDWHERIGHRTPLTVTAVIHEDIINIQVAQPTVQIATAANHEPLMSCLSFIVMISILIMDNERSVHNYIEFYSRTREVRHIDKLQLCFVKFYFADIADSVKAQIEDRRVNRMQKLFNFLPDLIVEVILNIFLE